MANRTYINRITLAWLNSVRGISNRTIEKILEYFGDAENIWNNFEKEKYNLAMLKPEILDELLRIKDSFPQTLTHMLKKEDANIVTFFDDEYPSKLRNIPNPPAILYYKGNLETCNTVSIAVVGSRKATSYGKWTTEILTGELADMGITIVSGLATGIDTIAHKTALKCDAKTIGVIGCGINVVYPAKNQSLYENIIDDGGTVITEYPFGMEPMSSNFPNRNRIISGLSDGVLVIEAQEKSGTLITAGHAAEQGRDVFAVPGNIDSLYSKGTNALIRDGAKIVTRAQDIIEEVLELRNMIMRSKKEVDFQNLNSLESAIVNLLSSGEKSILDINDNVNAQINDIFSTLTILEMKGIVKQLSGKKYVLANA